jgi:NAD(P)-dependent dehydrogenase (short-subunit alcohol dehydrogenase family)
MNLNLTGKTALVTGSTAGIGLAIAQSLYQEGVRVIVNGRTPERVESAIAAIRSRAPSAGELLGFVGDFTQAGAIDAVTRTYPTLDILINNLGVFEAKELTDVAPEDWANMFQTNVVTGALLSQRYLPRMLEANSGRIIFIASEAGVNIPADMIPYGVSKAAQIALARGLAEVTAGSAVTVNAVLPGPTYSEGVTTFLNSLPLEQSQSRAALESEFIRKLRPTSLIRRFARTEEVASLVTYLASPLASATNGAAMRAEGGLLRHT